MQIQDVNDAVLETMKDCGISYDLFRKFVDSDFETYHELTFEKNGLRYGWKKFEGKCGIPAFAWLGRLCTKGA